MHQQTHAYTYHKTELPFAWMDMMRNI